MGKYFLKEFFMRYLHTMGFQPTLGYALHKALFQEK
jgi:hypothetical protein